MIFLYLALPSVIQLSLSSTCVSPTALSCDLIQSITNPPSQPRSANIHSFPPNAKTFFSQFAFFPLFSPSLPLLHPAKPSILTIEHLHRQFDQLDRALQLHEPRPVWTVAAARCGSVDEGLLLPRYALTPFQAIS